MISRTLLLVVVLAAGSYTIKAEQVTVKHPSLADDKKMARSIIGVIDAQPDVWSRK